MHGHSLQLITVLALLGAGPVLAQEAAEGGRPAVRSQLPAYRGLVERFTLAPGGEVDGLLLADRTEIKTPPHLSAEVTAAIRPGDTVTVRGLKAAFLPLVQAVTIEDEQTGGWVVDRGLSAAPGPARPPPGTHARHEGSIRLLLHGMRGEVNGLLLSDGTTVRIDPIDASEVPAALRPGSFVVAEGEAHTSAYGTVIQASSIGARAVPVDPGKSP